MTGTERGEVTAIVAFRIAADQDNLLLVVIATMEAVLIEGLEPRQNRKRGDDFQAIEFNQVEDPEVKNQRRQQLLQELAWNLARRA